MEYDVRTTQAAQTDIVDIHQYISMELLSPATADRMVDTIETSLVNLAHSPHRYPKVLDDSLSAKGYHWIGIKNYMAFFTVDESSKTVYIERILYGRRDWAHLL